MVDNYTFMDEETMNTDSGTVWKRKPFIKYREGVKMVSIGSIWFRISDVGLKDPVETELAMLCYDQQNEIDILEAKISTLTDQITLQEQINQEITLKQNQLTDQLNMITSFLKLVHPEKETELCADKE